jgi:hypothetical protein
MTYRPEKPTNDAGQGVLRLSTTRTTSMIEVITGRASEAEAVLTAMESPEIVCTNEENS